MPALFHQQGMTALIISAWKGHDRCMDLLLPAGARLDLKLNEAGGPTALKAAKDHNHPKCVAILEAANAP